MKNPIKGLTVWHSHALILIVHRNNGDSKMKVKTINVDSTSRAWKKAQLKRHKAKVRNVGKKISKDPANY